jgi:hypothetical protein
VKHPVYLRVYVVTATKPYNLIFLFVTNLECGSTVVKVLRYKSEGRWFDPRWCHGILH